MTQICVLCLGLIDLEGPGLGLEGPGLGLVLGLWILALTTTLAVYHYICCKLEPLTVMFIHSHHNLLFKNELLITYHYTILYTSAA